MMLTRCPACQTVFRLHPEQVRARSGEVRCGHCFNPFNALQHRVAPAAGGGDENEAHLSGQHREPAPATTQSQPPTPTPAADDALDFELPEFPPFDDFHADANEGPGGTGLNEPTISRAMQSAQPSHAPGPEAPGGPPVLPPAASPWEESLPLEAALPEVIRSGRRRLSDTDDHTPRADDDTPPADAPPPVADAPARHEADDAPPAPLPEEPPAARHVDLEHLDATYGRPRRKQGAVARTLTGMAAGLLAGMLAAQTTYLFRTEISRALPGMRPLLEAGCAAFGCDVPLPQDIALISGMETSDLQSDPARPGHYVLFTTVKNRADYPQAWPHLELTLTDAVGTPVARRVLAPAEWGASGNLAAGMPARATIPVRLPFRLDGASPTGYRVYVFYP